jgi:hypothetical protein
MKTVTGEGYLKTRRISYSLQNNTQSNLEEQTMVLEIERLQATFPDFRERCE